MNRLDMLKKIPGIVWKFVLRYSKYLFPGIALIITALAVIISLDQRQKSIDRRKAKEEQIAHEQELAEAQQMAVTEVPLEENNDEKLQELIAMYYEALSNGDGETLTSICDNLDESEVIRLTEQSKYVDYKVESIYDQAGPQEGSYIVYAYCFVNFDKFPGVDLALYKAFYIRTDENDRLYIVEGELSDEENDYISKVASQDDVREFNNKVNVEYNDTIVENPDILNYLIEIDTAVSTSVGERIAELNATEEIPEQVEDNGEDIGNVTEDIVTAPIIRYATATTRVNVRASDSANAERVGEAMKGERFEVIEELLNGWTKIRFNDQDAYIKSEYLSMIQSAEGQPTIGMLTAKSEVNVRSLPEPDSERVGALLAGDQLEIVAVEDGWCAVKFNDMLAYVNVEFVDMTIFE